MRRRRRPRRLASRNAIACNPSRQGRGEQTKPEKRHEPDRRSDRRPPPPPAKALLLARRRFRRDRARHRRRDRAWSPAATASPAWSRRRSPGSPSPASSPRTATRSSSSTRSARPTAVKGVIVAIDSTGGATTGGEALYEALLRARPPRSRRSPRWARSAPRPPTWRRSPPTTSSPAARSITGSIGVIFQYPRGQPAPRQARRRDRGGEERAAQGRAVAVQAGDRRRRKAVIAGIVRDTYDWFVDIVAERREPRARRRADARRRPHLHRPSGARRQADRRDRRRGGGDRLARHEGRRRASCRSGTGSRADRSGGFFSADACAPLDRPRSSASRRISPAAACSTGILPGAAQT